MNQLLNVTKTLQKLTVSSRCRLTPVLLKADTEKLPANEVLFANPTRNANFFNKCKYNLQLLFKPTSLYSQCLLKIYGKV